MKNSPRLPIRVARLVLLFAFLLPNAFVTAQTLNPRLELKLLTNPQPFFSMLDDPSGFDGYVIDVNKAILKNAGYDVIVESLPWARILKRSENHQFSAISAIVRTPERENSFFWVTPISVNPIAIYTLGHPPNPINSIKEVSNMGSIAVLRNDYRQQILTSRYGAQTMPFNRWSAAIQSLSKGRVKSLFFSDMGLVLTCIDEQLDCSRIKRVFTYNESVSYLALRKKEELTPIYEALKKSAEEFKTSVAFQTLVSRYLNSDHPAAKFLEVDNGIIHIK